MRTIINSDDYTAYQTRFAAWLGAVTPRRSAGFIRIRQSVRVSASALWKETAPPD